MKRFLGLLLAALLFIVAPAHAADTKVSGLTAASSAASTDLFYIVTTGPVSNKITFANIESSLTLNNETGTLNVNKGGTGQTSYTDGQLLIGNTTGNTLTKGTLTAGSSMLSVTNGGGSITLDVVPTNITSLGTITTGTWNATTVAVSHGGTGQTSYTDGQLLIGNTTGNTLTPATLTAGSNITITNGHGTITIAGTAAAASGSLLSTTVFTSTGTNTWTKSTGTTAYALLVGAGASAGGCALTSTNQENGSGGGGGGNAIFVKIDVSGIASSTVTIGTGGSAPTAGANNGNDGGVTSWTDGTNTVTAGGGTHSNGVAAGAGISGNGGAGGTSGTISGAGQTVLYNLPGGAGDFGFGVSTTLAIGGEGGEAGYGMGTGGAPSIGTGAAGSAGNNYGGGGSGCANSQSQTAKSGGAGANGFAIVWEYK